MQLPTETTTEAETETGTETETEETLPPETGGGDSQEEFNGGWILPTSVAAITIGGAAVAITVYFKKKK